MLNCFRLVGKVGVYNGVEGRKEVAAKRMNPRLALLMLFSTPPIYPVNKTDRTRNTKETSKSDQSFLSNIQSRLVSIRSRYGGDGS